MTQHAMHPRQIAEQAVDSTRDAAREASPWIIRLGRLGFACKGAVYVLIGLLALQAATGDLLLSVVGARLTSAGVNLVVNRRLVFDAQRRVRTRVAATRYAALATALLGLNFLLLSALGAAGVALLPAKVLTELALVSTSFAAQRAFVFRPPAVLTGASQGRPTSPTVTSTTVDTTSH